MSLKSTRSKPPLSKGLFNLQDQYLNNIMDLRTGKGPVTPVMQKKFTEGRKLDYSRSFAQGHGRMMSRYFTFESLFLLVCLTASLLILPLILPPLPPPPFMLLLLPIFILSLLLILAFMPSNVRDATSYTYT